MTSERVTVYNARVDPATRAEAYAPTVLAGVSWYCRTEAGVTEGGMKAANVYMLRIPEDVDAGGKAYAAQEADRRAESVDALWTIQKGDVITGFGKADILYMSNLIAQLEQTDPGSNITLEIMRRNGDAYEEIKVPVTTQ